MIWALLSFGIMASEITGSGTIHGHHGEVDARGDEGVAGGAIDAEQGADVTGGNGVDIFHLVGVHADQAADFDFFAASGC